MGNSQPIHTIRKEKSCSEENNNGLVDQPFDKDVGMRHTFNQPPQQKSGIDIGLY